MVEDSQSQHSAAAGNSGREMVMVGSEVDERPATDAQGEFAKGEGLEPASNMHHVIIALRLLVAGVLIFSVAYPGFVTVVSQLLWPAQAQGGLVELNGEPVGAELIGQEFAADVFFHPRPSSTGYDAMDSGSENLGPLNDVLTKRVQERLEELEEQGVEASRVPVSWVTESGSALDPHITPEAARLQIPRVSRASGLSAAVLEKLITEHTEGRFLGLFGWERVNVLLLNLEIQQRLGDSQ